MIFFSHQNLIKHMKKLAKVICYRLSFFFVSTTHTTFDIKKSKKNIKIAIIFRGRGFDPFDPRILSIKLDVVLSLNGLEVRTLSHCI
ncbi:hypothetical protein SFRURICE_006344 [Spodoptera frugiperda]|nr:hypothetical protein SFRURICE_006344 [Spodoptera frugiperda]